MTAKKAAAKKAAKKVAPPKPTEEENKNLGAVPGDEPETNNAVVEENEEGNPTIEGTGKFQVVNVAGEDEEPVFRMFNEKGQCVSGEVRKGDKLPNGKPALAKLVREARRSNALRAKREIRTPRGHEAM